jgi:hypothetical protein
MEPVELTSTAAQVFAPRREMEPEPNCLVIAEMARSMPEPLTGMDAGVAVFVI